MRMTEVSGDDCRAKRRTSMPSVCGILMSVINTSKLAELSFFLAASPAFTVSTRWPSLRREISSISQMERWSSHTRMLAMRHLRVHHVGVRITRCRFGMQYLQDKLRAAARGRLDGNLGSVRLNDLVNNGEPQPRAAFKLRLKRLKYLFCQMRWNARAGVSNSNPQKITDASHRNRDRAFSIHRP